MTQCKLTSAGMLTYRVSAVDIFEHEYSISQKFKEIKILEKQFTIKRFYTVTCVEKQGRTKNRVTRNSIQPRCHSVHDVSRKLKKGCYASRVLVRI